MEAHLPGGPAEAPRYNSLQRLYLSIVSPLEIFQDIGRKPTWALCLAVYVVVAAATQFVVLPHIDMAATIEQRLADRGQDIPEEDRDRIVEQAERFKFFGPIAAVVFVPLVMALLGAVFFLMLKLLGSDADYRRTLSATLHAYWPPALIASALTIVLVQRFESLTADEAQNVVKSHLGAFLSQETPAWLKAVASSIDLFVIWTVVLLVLGLSTVGKISRAKAATGVVALWALYVAGKAGFAALTS